ncbi:hypothetical protein TIFTF001_052806 [Ficus carica]|uniref:Uncharacterized protein n=1 Tax=Ficus carica TaxID=3494 RepID=A0AA88ECG2_FICCA|nr:hypothetical protein TIFTF001_052805 [Ficus carica]GMN72186.1 hypothetical protein TIFTF001_052806 [Ficus carica]
MHADCDKWDDDSVQPPLVSCDGDVILGGTTSKDQDEAQGQAGIPQIDAGKELSFLRRFLCLLRK